MKAIEFKNVSFSYEGCEAKVLKDVSFSVEFGEVALLSGFSGEGKSTVLSLIAGIIPNVTSGDASGAVLISGENIIGQRMSSICRKVGVVLQNAEAQIVQQIVEDEIAFGCENFGFSQNKISESIARSCDQMKLDPVWKTRTLSGGQKQRLITAATLATGQKILVLDEPLANLDKQGANILMNVLRKLAKSGMRCSYCGTSSGYGSALCRYRLGVFGADAFQRLKTSRNTSLHRRSLLSTSVLIFRKRNPYSTFITWAFL